MSTQTRTISAPWFRHGEDRNEIAMCDDVVELSAEDIARGEASGAFEESPPRTLRARGPEDTGAGIDDDDDEAASEDSEKPPPRAQRRR